MPTPSKYHTVAIVGVNQESAGILSTLARTNDLKIVKVINPETEPVAVLRRCQQLDIVIDTTYDEHVQEQLHELKLKNVDILSGLSARMLFGSGKEGAQPGPLHDYRMKVLESLGEIQRTIHLARNKEELLKLILNISIQSIEADSGSIMLVDPEKHSLRLESADGLKNAIVGTTMQKLGKGVSGRVVKTKQPIIVTGPTVGSLGGTERMRSDLVSAICCPLLIGDEVIGVLNINSKTQSRVFGDQDLEYVKKLAEFTAGIIQTSHSYSTTSRSTLNLSLINSLRDILNLNYSFHERLNLACMKISNTLEAEMCKYYEFDNQTQEFLTKASSAVDLNLTKGKAVHLNTKTAKMVLESSDTVCLSTPLANGARRWFVAQPVKVEGKLLGLLVVQMVSPKREIPEELKAFEKIASVLARNYVRHQTLESSRIQAIKFSVISELAYNFANVPDLQHLGTIVVSNACLILEAETCILRTVDKNETSLNVFDSFSYQPAGHLRKVELFDRIVTEELTGAQPLIHIENLRASDFDSKAAQVCESVLSMGFVVNNRLAASLSLYDKRPTGIHDSRSFSAPDKEIFLNFCLQVSKALQRFL
jgi:putative methionine-R-sulfoxide reductase with GAF domain